MRVQCPSCGVRYKLDDSKVGETGLRVKCSKCGHIFRVEKPPSEELDDLPAFSPEEESPEATKKVETSKTHPMDPESTDKHPLKEGLRGNLETIGLPDIIQMLHLGRKTGGLHIKRGEEKKTIYFLNGEIVTATTNIDAERMSVFLHKQKKISSETMAAIIEEADVTGRPEETIIREAVPLSKKENQARVDEYVADLIYGVFHWNSGSVLFIENEESHDECLQIRNTTENLVMEGVRRIDEWSRIRQSIPSHRVILQQCPEPPTKSDQILLNSEEWKIMALVDGKRTISEICSEARETEFDVSKVLYGLLSIGLLEKVGTKEEEPAAPPAPDKPQKRGEAEFRKTLIFTPAKLAMTKPEQRLYPLGMAQLTIGRSSKDTDIAIPNDGHASRVHAQIKYDGANYVCSDLGSTNGTMVNGEKIDSVVLKHGDEIQVGQTHFIFHEK